MPVSPYMNPVSVLSAGVWLTHYFLSPSVTVSLGVASTDLPGFEPAPGTDAARLVQAADEALYRAKARGRNCVDGG